MKRILGLGSRKTGNKLVISVEKLERRVALLEDGRLEEYSVERNTTRNIVGSVYKGKVKNIEQGLKAMFVDIGFEKNAFLHFWDAGLAVVLVGDDPASRAYVRSKDKMCRELGLHSVKLELPSETTQEGLLVRIDELNRDSAIHGILVQSPPPKQIDEAAVVRALDPMKDVDGFHPINVAKLALGEESGFVPCTPLGCQRLLVESGIEIAGAHVVVLGRSMIVGKPVALLLMQKAPHANATVTVVHSRSRNLPEITRSADIIIAAIGQAGFVKAEHVRDGAVVVDVGINRVNDAAAPRGYRLVGDVAFEEVAAKAAAITPVPGGVGPMTIAMLMTNTVKACRLQTASL